MTTEGPETDRVALAAVGFESESSRRGRMLIPLALVALSLSIVAALAFGGVAIDASAWWRGLPDATARTIVVELRAPRVLLAACTGAALAVAGCAMQSLFRNPLADPGLTGVSAGAAVGAIAAIVLGDRLGTDPAWLATRLQPLAACTAAAATTVLLLAFARRDTVATLLLAGVAINALAGAAIGALTWIADDAKLRNLAYWTLGSFGQANWTSLAVAGPALVVPVVLAPRLARAMDALLLGEIEAGYLGLRVARLRTALVALAALAVGAAVSSAGIVGFIGLVVPHMVRAMTGPAHGRLLPAAALAGATLAVLADLVARTAAAPAELPVGVLLAAIGAPLFLWLLKRHSRD